MTGHSDSGSALKKASDGVDDVPNFSDENLQSNMKVIYYREENAYDFELVNDFTINIVSIFLSTIGRTFLSIIDGVIAGILGITSLTGFIFYLVVMAITSVGLAAKAKFLVHSYFDSWNRVIFDGFLSGLMSFVLFWTFAYNIVHIF